MKNKDSIFDPPSKKNKTQFQEQDQSNSKNSVLSQPPKTEKPFGMGIDEGIFLLPKDPRNIKTSDALAFIKQAKKFHSEIERNLDEIYKKLGQSPDEITRFLDNPSNFTKSQWEIFQQQRKNLRDTLRFDEIEIDPSSYLETNDKFFKDEVNKKPRNDNKERKGKMIGARRQWIPMN